MTMFDCLQAQDLHSKHTYACCIRNLKIQAIVQVKHVTQRGLGVLQQPVALNCGDRGTCVPQKNALKTLNT